MDNTQSTAVIHHDLSPQQKAAHLTVLIIQGREYTTGQVATMFGMSNRGAWGMLNNIAGAVPLTTTEDSPCRWRRFDY